MLRADYHNGNSSFLKKLLNQCKHYIRHFLSMCKVVFLSFPFSVAQKEFKTYIFKKSVKISQIF